MARWYCVHGKVGVLGEVVLCAWRGGTVCMARWVCLVRWYCVHGEVVLCAWQGGCAW